MKIISGKWGGQSLKAHQKIKSKAELRPTTEKVREAIFDILEARVIDQWDTTRVLDLFAGTGAFGFESLSRSAASVDFVEHHPATARELKKAVEGFQVSEIAHVHCKGVLEALTGISQTFDLVFMDPPYDEGWIVPTMNRIFESGRLSTNGVVVCEHSKRELTSPLEGYWKRLDARRYGDTMVSIFCLKTSEKYFENRF